MMSTKATTFLSLQSAARLAGIAPRTLRQRIEDGEIRAIPFYGKDSQYRFKTFLLTRDFEQWRRRAA